MSRLRLRRNDGAFTAVGCLWVITAVLGVVVAGLSLLAILDPEGTKAADDSDPFGTPPSRTSSAALLGLGVLMVVWPLAFVRRGEVGPDQSGGAPPRDASPR